ncbi:MAG: MFS transporter [Thioalkalispiraceae bacterium]|jgi:PPP family 3-phenylpropionic acid transporter
MSPVSSATPYWRLSGFYFFYFASLGAFIPYLGPYLKSLKISEFQIGVIIGITMATKIIAPNIWGWIADHSGKRMLIIRLGCFFAALTFLGLLIEQTYFIVILVMTVFSFFWNAALPQFEATTFSHLTDREERYSSIRLWGSIGFIIAVVILGYVFQVLPYSALPYFVSALLIAIWLMSMTVPESAAGHLTLDHEPLKKTLSKPHVIGLLVGCFCMQASHGPYYAFYNLYMQSFQYSSSAIGWLWGVGVTAEVILFLFMHKISIRYHLPDLLMISFVLAILRWSLITFFPAHVPVMIFAQCLHAATFGLYHAAAIRLIHQFFRGRHQGKGQALYSSVSYGAGGALGSLYGGFAWDYIDRSWVFAGSIVFCVIGLWMIYRYVKPGMKSRQEIG